MGTIAQHFELAWNQIAYIYKKGSICSERHLQAELFHILYSNHEFLMNYELRVEPNLYYQEGEKKEYLGIIPDILVIDKKSPSILAHVELKYVPHGYIEYEKDIINMAELWKLKSRKPHFFLDTNPYTGDWNGDNKYSIAENFLLIYGCIGNEYSHCIANYEEMWKQQSVLLAITPEYKHLIGSVSLDKEPHFNFSAGK